MKKLLAILVAGLLWCNVGFALPECEGKDDSKWSNCQGTYLKKEVRSGLTRDYTGEFGSVPGKRHGKGSSKVYKDGSFISTYVGEYKNDKPHGQGTTLWKNGDKYVGEWKDGAPHGQGTYTYVDGAKYVGEYKDGKKDGQGTYTYVDGKQYVGEFKNGKMHGIGTYSLINFKPKITETISGGLIETVVPITKSGGVIYVGEFKHGKPNGQGSWTYCAYSKPYRCHSKLNEQGIWTYKNGGKYVGQIKDGLEHGEGIKTYPSGNIVKGVWKNGKLVKTK